MNKFSVLFNTLTINRVNVVPIDSWTVLCFVNQTKCNKLNYNILIGFLTDNVRVLPNWID